MFQCRNGFLNVESLTYCACLNNNNNNICIAPLGRNFRGAEARKCATEKREERKPGRSSRNVFSLHLNTVKESLLRIVFGSMFQTARAEHPKTHVAKVVAMAG